MSCSIRLCNRNDFPILLLLSGCLIYLIIYPDLLSGCLIYLIIYPYFQLPYFQLPRLRLPLRKMFLRRTLR